MKAAGVRSRTVYFSLGSRFGAASLAFQMDKMLIAVSRNSHIVDVYLTKIFKQHRRSRLWLCLVVLLGKWCCVYVCVLCVCLCGIYEIVLFVSCAIYVCLCCVFHMFVTYLSDT